MNSILHFLFGSVGIMMSPIWRDRGKWFIPTVVVTSVVVAGAALSPIIPIPGSGGNQEGTANFWVDTNGGTCVRQTTPSSYIDAQACSSPADAYASASVGDTVLILGGTYNASWDFNYRSTFNGSTCDPLGSWGPVVTSSCVKVSVVSGENVIVNGHILSYGSGLWFKGEITNGITNPASYASRAFNVTVNGYVDTEAVSESQYPTHVTFEGIDAKQIGVFSSKYVAFKNMDAGPQVMTTNCSIVGNFGGSLPGNDTAYGGGIIVQPDYILFEGVLFHGANRDQNGANSDCHTGGFFLKGGTNLVFRKNVWRHNAVYDVQIQSVGGGAIGNLTFENNWFGCPVDWSYLSGPGDSNCIGQSDIQFNAESSFANILIRFNSFQNGVSAFTAATFSNARMVANVGSTPSSGVCLDSGWISGSGYNVWVGGTCWGSDINGGTLSGLFTSLTTNSQNLHLLNTSNVANNVVSVSSGDYALTDDIDGQSRPLDANRDAGSDEQTG